MLIDYSYIVAILVIVAFIVS